MKDEIKAFFAAMVCITGLIVVMAMGVILIKLVYRF